jgi:hypothetical protein
MNIFDWIAFSLVVLSITGFTFFFFRQEIGRGVLFGTLIALNTLSAGYFLIRVMMMPIN